MNKTRKVIFNIARVIAAVIMLQTLYFKFGGHEQSIELFTALGAEPWGRYASGALELLASILLFVPKKQWYGGILTIIIMLGALGAHLTTLGFEGDDLQLTIMAIVTLVCGMVVVGMTKGCCCMGTCKKK